jgi:hypothetical protein
MYNVGCFTCVGSSYVLTNICLSKEFLISRHHTWKWSVKYPYTWKRTGILKETYQSLGVNHLVLLL